MKDFYECRINVKEPHEGPWTFCPPNAPQGIDFVEKAALTYAQGEIERLKDVLTPFPDLEELEKNLYADDFMYNGYWQHKIEKLLAEVKISRVRILELNRGLNDCKVVAESADEVIARDIGIYRKSVNAVVAISKRVLKKDGELNVRK